MSNAFPLNVKPAKGRGRPPAEDRERYPSGEVRPAGPTKEAAAQRRLAAADPTMGQSPLDVAFANGWLTADERRTGRRYAGLRMQAGLGGRATSAGQVAESDAPPDMDRGVPLSELSGAALAEAWDAVFKPLSDPEARERRAAVAMAKWRVINDAMTPDQRSEVFAVCVLESWPQWILQRCAGNAIRAHAEAEKRSLTDDELARIARRFGSSWERKRDLLVAGLAAINAALSPAPAGSARPAPEPVLQARTPIPSFVAEREVRVDDEGEVQLVVERRARR